MGYFTTDPDGLAGKFQPAPSTGNGTWSNVNDFVEDVGYGIASMFGLGEQANDLINWLKRLFGNDYNTTKNSSELLNALYKIAKTKGINMNKLLSQIDAALSKLPVSLSSNMKKALRGVRSDLLKQRATVAADLSRYETTMANATQLASGQDYLSPSRKRDNQKRVEKMTEDLNSLPDYSSVEIKI